MWLGCEIATQFIYVESECSSRLAPLGRRESLRRRLCLSHGKREKGRENFNFERATITVESSGQMHIAIAQCTKTSTADRCDTQLSDERKVCCRKFFAKLEGQDNEGPIFFKNDTLGEVRKRRIKETRIGTLHIHP